MTYWQTKPVNHILRNTGYTAQIPRTMYNLPISRLKNQKEKLASNKSLNKLMKVYVKETSVHGLKYILYEGSSALDRLIWLLVFLASLGCLIALCSTMIARFFSGPTTTVVKDTHYPLYHFPFPGVSVCPTEKIMRDAAFNYIYQKLNIRSGEVNNDSVDQFLVAMHFFQHPVYSRMTKYLGNSQDILPRLAALNLTDFMLEVMPSCKDTFNECFWHGKSENCCALFHKQRSEEGFCYSFNTLTSQDIRSCEGVTSNEYGDIGNSQKDANCILRRNSASGTTTGLEVFLRGIDSSHFLVNHTVIIGESGVLVQLHTSDEYPESGMGRMVPAVRGVKMTTAIKAYVTQSLPAVRTLPISQRNCYFPDEIELGVAAQYSQRSCYIECRLDYFQQVCGCRPYYFNMLDNRVPVCNALQLKCIANSSSDVKFFRPPVESVYRGFTLPEGHNALDCSHCLPTCIESYYDNNDDITTDTQEKAQESFGYLDLYYKSGGAVYYERDVTFGWLDLLVSIGGTAGLLLGISLLSVVELLFWVAKILYFCLNKKKVESIPQPPRGPIYQTDFYLK